MKRIVCTLFIFVLSLSFMFVMGIKEARAEDTTVVYVDPPVSYVSLGQTFSVNVNIANVRDLYGYEFALGYNSTILNVTEVVIQPFLNKPTDPWMKNKEGHVWVCDCSVYPAKPTSGSGTLVTIIFNVIGMGDCEIDLGVPDAWCDRKPGTKLVAPMVGTKPEDADMKAIPHKSVSGQVKFRPSERGIATFLNTPSHLRPGDSALLKATVWNTGSTEETNVELRLLIDSSIVDFEVISSLQGGFSYTLSYLWTPSLVEATYNVTAYASPVSDEDDITNNDKSARVLVSYVINVPFHYPTIENAIDAASPGDVIVVSRGTYYECLTIGKSVTLTGHANNTIIDGSGNYEVISVTANNVHISNLTIQNGIVDIYLHNVKYTVISGNTVKDTLPGGAGIFVEDSNNTLISDNIILNNHYGIGLAFSSYGNITNNTIIQNEIAIYPDQPRYHTNNIIIDNTESNTNNTSDNNTDCSNPCPDPPSTKDTQDICALSYADSQSTPNGDELYTMGTCDSAEAGNGSLTVPWASIVLLALTFEVITASALLFRRFR